MGMHSTSLEAIRMIGHLWNAKPPISTEINAHKTENHKHDETTGSTLQITCLFSFGNAGN
jgi:hypothetical protein